MDSSGSVVRARDEVTVDANSWALFATVAGIKR